MTTITKASGLRVLPVEALKLFYTLGIEAGYEVTGRVLPLPVIPGTIETGTTEENGIISKEISFKVGQATPEIAQNIAIYEKTRLIAEYTDEAGYRRVCGTPDYPLSLTHKQADGAYICTLTGKDTEHDRYRR